MISLLVTLACVDSKKLFSHCCGAIVTVYAEDEEVIELCGSTSQYPVRFPELKCMYVAYLQYGHQLRGG